MASYELTWIGADGIPVPLNLDNGAKVLRGVIGIDAPTPSLTLEQRLSADGAVLLGRRYAERRVVLPLYIRDNAGRGRTVVRQLANTFTGPGVLRYTDSDGSKDLTNVIYEGGLGGGGDVEFADSRKVVVSLIALDPWWYGPEATVSVGTDSTMYDADLPYDVDLPYSGGSAATLFVDGDHPITPKITLWGPFDFVTVTIPGGDMIEPVGGVAAGDVLVIDSHPDSRGPSLNGGPINWTLLTPESRLFTVEPGSPTVVVSAGGVTGTSAVELSWRPRSRTP